MQVILAKIFEKFTIFFLKHTKMNKINVLFNIKDNIVTFQFQGTLMSSLFIAVVGRQMQLSLTEKRVNHVVAESQLSST